MNCNICKQDFEDAELYEYRGAYMCEEHHTQGIEKREHERQEVMQEVAHSVRSQADGEWHNGGYKTMKTDPHTGKPITKIKEPLRLQEYERFH